MVIKSGKGRFYIITWLSNSWLWQWVNMHTGCELCRVRSAIYYLQQRDRSGSLICWQFDSHFYPLSWWKTDILPFKRDLVTTLHPLASAVCTHSLVAYGLFQIYIMAQNTYAALERRSSIPYHDTTRKSLILPLISSLGSDQYPSEPAFTDQNPLTLPNSWITVRGKEQDNERNVDTRIAQGAILSSAVPRIWVSQVSDHFPSEKTHSTALCSPCSSHWLHPVACLEGSVLIADRFSELIHFKGTIAFDLVGINFDARSESDALKHCGQPAAVDGCVAVKSNSAMTPRMTTALLLAFPSLKAKVIKFVLLFAKLHLDRHSRKEYEADGRTLWQSLVYGRFSRNCYRAIGSIIQCWRYCGLTHAHQSS